MFAILRQNNYNNNDKIFCKYKLTIDIILFQNNYDTQMLFKKSILNGQILNNHMENKISIINKTVRKIIFINVRFFTCVTNNIID